MSMQNIPAPDHDTQTILDCLRQTAAKTLDRKRRLGQYAVVWQDNAPVAVGDDAPAGLLKTVLQTQSQS